jgi:hypothetical protein
VREDNMNNLELIRTKPSVVKGDDGKERIDTGRYSRQALANHIASHPGEIFTARDLAKITPGGAHKGNVEKVRRDLRIISDLIIDAGIGAVVEWSGRKITGIARYNPQSEYHLRLASQEISLRQRRKDGSDEKYLRALDALPLPPPAIGP